MKKAVIIGIIILLIVIGIIYLIINLNTPKAKASETNCKTNNDCACGVHINTRECFVGNKDYVDSTKQCPDFCTGFAGDLKTECTDNSCILIKIPQ